MIPEDLHVIGATTDGRLWYTLLFEEPTGSPWQRFEADKTRLDDDRHHWDWWPPGWACAFEQDGRRWERHFW